MTLNRDLFLAILSMDSYNRGYGFGVGRLSETGSLGRAILLAATSEQQQGWQSAGFYALAYDMTGMADGGQFADGERVISYRGSDEGRAQDIIYGYGTALGWPLSEQGNLAIAFARAVAGDDCPGKRHRFHSGMGAANDNAVSERKAA
jgi:hypothetical protein